MFYIVSNSECRIEPRKEYMVIDCNDLTYTKVLGKQLKYLSRVDNRCLNVEGSNITKSSNKCLDALTTANFGIYRIKYGSTVTNVQISGSNIGIVEPYALYLDGGTLYYIDKNLKSYKVGDNLA